MCETCKYLAHMELFAVVFTAIANVILGLLTYLKNPKGTSNRLLALLALQISVWAILNYLSLHQTTAIATLFWIRWDMVPGAFMGPTIYLLVRSFPHRQLSTSKLLLFALIALTLITAILAISPYMFIDVVFQGSNINPIPGPAIVLFAINFLGSLTLAFITLLRRFKQAQGMEKIQLKFLVLSLIITFSLITTTQFLFVILLNTSFFIQFGPLYTLILVGSISYAIIKHNFLDITALVARTTSYSIFFLLIFILYSNLLFAVIRFLPKSIPTNPVYVSLAILAALTLHPLRLFLEKLTDRIFFKGRYSTEALLSRLTHIMASEINIHQVSELILSTIITHMRLTKAAFLIVDKNHQAQFETSNFPADKLPTAEEQRRLFDGLNVSPLLVLEELETESLKDVLRRLEVTAVILLKTETRVLGLLLLGSKASGDPYSEQDQELLQIFAPQAAVALQNAQAYLEIQEFAHTLEKKVEERTRELKASQQRELAKAQELLKLKDQFVFVATRELKNPVTAMKGFLSMFDEGTFGAIPEPMQDPIKQIEVANQQLVNLVNDLLEIARSEAKNITIMPQTVNICDLTDNAIKSVKPLADQKSLTLTHSCKVPNLAKVTADPNRLLEIVNNLISNAIKYSKSGTITITHELPATSHTLQATSLPRSEALRGYVPQAMVVTHISDQGIGISPEHQSKIFTQFFRAEEEAAKGIPGTGLGLFIVKQLVEKMGGQIWFTSELNQGSVFSFSLPKATSDVAKAESGEVKAPPSETPAN